MDWSYEYESHFHKHKRWIGVLNDNWSWLMNAEGISINISDGLEFLAITGGGL